MRIKTGYIFFFFFFNDPAPPEIYPLPLHDALPIWAPGVRERGPRRRRGPARDRSARRRRRDRPAHPRARSEEHTSELQSQSNLVCRLLLEKKKKKYISD